MMIKTNVDTVREEIMRLESALIFDQNAWEKVLADLRAEGRAAGLADAERRMNTSKTIQMDNRHKQENRQ